MILKTSQQTKLNVAIVNEDQSVRVDKKSIILVLANSKNIEQRQFTNWFVVTRRSAWILGKREYQLVLTIPSDFLKRF